MKPGTEADFSFTNAASIPLGLAFLLCPLLFFTDLTRNPYYTQIALLGIIVSLLCCRAAVASLRLGRNVVPSSPADLPLWGFVAACLLSLCAAYALRPAFIRPSVYYEGLRAMSLLLVNWVAVFYLGKMTAAEKPGYEVSPWTLWWLLLWGMLWLPYRTFAGSVPPQGIVDRIFGFYGTFLWLGGLALAWPLYKGGTRTGLANLAIVAGVLASGYGILQTFGMEFIWIKALSPYGARAVSTFGNPNFLSSYLVVLLPLLLLYYLRAERLGLRLFYGAALVIYSASLLASLTRSSWLGAAVGTACLFALLPEARRLAFSRRAALAAVTAPALLLVLFWPSSNVGDYHPTVVQRVEEMGQMKGSVFSFEGGAASAYGPWHQRLMIWSVSGVMTAESPFTGVGWGLLELFYPYYQAGFLQKYEALRSLRTHANGAHNEIVEVLSQTGIIGLGMLVWLFIVAGFLYIRNRGRVGGEARFFGAAALAGMAGMVADNMLNVSLHFAIPALVFWWLFGAFAGDPAFALPSSPRPLGRAGKLFAACAAGVGLLFSFYFFSRWMSEVHYFRGFSLFRGGNVPAAVAELETARRWNGHEVNMNYELANALSRSGKTAEALTAYGQAIEANAGYDELFFNRSVLLARDKGDVPSALRDAETALHINPLQYTTYNYLADLYLSRPDEYASRACDKLALGMAVFPAASNLTNTVGYFCAKAGRKKEAAAMFRKALFFDPYDSMLLTNYRKAAEESSSVDAAFVVYIQELGRTASAFAARSADALPAAERLVGKYPSDPSARALLVSVYLALGNMKAAREQVRLLQASHPEHPKTLAVLAMLESADGNTAAASDATNRLLALNPGDRVGKSLRENLSRR